MKTYATGLGGAAGVAGEGESLGVVVVALVTVGSLFVSLSPFGPKDPMACKGAGALPAWQQERRLTDHASVCYT